GGTWSSHERGSHPKLTANFASKAHISSKSSRAGSRNRQATNLVEPSKSWRSLCFRSPGESAKLPDRASPGPSASAPGARKRPDDERASAAGPGGLLDLDVETVEQAERELRLLEALQAQLAHRLRPEAVPELAPDARRDEDLVRLRRIGEAGREVGHVA